MKKSHAFKGVSEPVEKGRRGDLITYLATGKFPCMCRIGAFTHLKHLLIP